MNRQAHTGAPGGRAPAPGEPWLQAGQVWQQWARRAAAGPFDLLRAQYAGAVRAGVIRPSLLASSRFERGVAQWESLVLGPWARER